MNAPRLGVVAGLLALSAVGSVPTPSQAQDQDLSHRQTALDVLVRDAAGRAVSGATVDLAMREHDFRFGTQITADRYRNDAAERAFVDGLFNSFTFTAGGYWRITESNENNARVDLTAAAALANASGKHVRGHTIVWPQNKGWLNPEDTLPEYTYKSWISDGPILNDQYNPSATHLKSRIDGRIADFLALTEASGNPHGGFINDFDATNETFDFQTQVAPGIDAERMDIFTPRLVDAGLYDDRLDAYADWYVQMRAARPDARLVFNETAVLAPASDDMAYAVRDRVQALLDRGAPIDAIGVQMHMSNGLRSLNDLNRKVDILAETGLPIEITEFDNFNGGSYGSTPNGERRSFENALRLAFENPNVEGFTMWGYRDDDHWVGNSALFDGNLNLKPEGQPYFDLVFGEWWTDVEDAAVDGSGKTAATLTRGTYELTLDHAGQSFTESLTVTMPRAELFADVDADAAFLLGDADGNGTLDIDDAWFLRLAVINLSDYTGRTGLDPLDQADTDRDGQVTLRDYLRFANYFDADDRAAILADVAIDAIPGDFDASGRVDQADLNLVLSNWGVDASALPLGWLLGRPTSGAVAQAELNAVLANWGAASAPDFQGTRIPEPTALALVMLGLACRRTRRVATTL
ncbi:MAG: endo-1,4-beta-xylanase [Planctomycetota bacterium]